MTKAFTPHGLLSTSAMEDKPDRSAKRLEELACESGASLINVLNQLPALQTGLFDAATVRKCRRKRESVSALC